MHLKPKLNGHPFLLFIPEFNNTAQSMREVISVVYRLDPTVDSVYFQQYHDSPPTLHQAHHLPNFPFGIGYGHFVEFTLKIIRPVSLSWYFFGCDEAKIYSSLERAL